jgi:outer membrane protein TolC
VQREHANEPSTEVSVDPEKTYELPELIDIAQRTNPETRVAWERARQAAIAVGLAEGTYYPLLAATATGGAAHLALPFPANVFPGGLPNGYLTANTQLVLPIVSLEWWLLDFGRRASAVDAAKALKLEATVGFNAKHQQIVFAVTKAFYALTAVRGRVAAAHAALDSAQTLEAAAEARRAHGEGTPPEARQAHEGVASAE